MVMNSLKKTLFIIAVVIVSAQSVRHAYYRWIEPSVSVLDKYEAALRDDIKNAGSLEMLQTKYEEAHKKVVAYEADKTNPKVERYERDSIEPFKSEQMLKSAIEGWEKSAKEIFKIRFFWIVGLIFLIVGYILYQKINVWLGMTFIIAGFSEMLYWTSPSFFSDSTIEFSVLLINKIIFSLVTLALLIVVAYLTDTLKDNNKKTA
jgi:hypothetical protein